MRLRTLLFVYAMMAAATPAYLWLGLWGAAACYLIGLAPILARLGLYLVEGLHEPPRRDGREEEE